MCIATWESIYRLCGESSIRSSVITSLIMPNRSTNLDSWQLDQLRRMKVGGNTSATEFFTKHGGAALLNDSDTKKKYSSRVAELYKEELNKRVKEDAAKFPSGIALDGVAEPSAPSSSAAGEEDDFFSSWDKPASKPVKSAAASTPASPPVIGRAATVSAAPRTVTSSSLHSSTTGTTRPASKLGASRLNSSPATSTLSTPTTTTASAAGARKSKLGGLGAKKAASPLDFEEAQRKAEEEAERIRQLGYDREKERQEEEERQKAAKAAKLVPNSPAAGSSSGSAKTTAAAVETKPLGNAHDLERLGMGMKRLGFGAVPAAAASKSRYVISSRPYRHG